MEHRDQHQFARPEASIDLAHPVASKPQPFTEARFVQLLELRPMMFWGGLWMSLFFVGVVSIGSLLSPGLVGGRSSSGAAIGTSTTPTQPIATAQEPSKTSLPLWLFGAIVFSCTAGSILISKQLPASAPARAPRSSPRSAPRRSPQLPAPQPLQVKRKRRKPLPNPLAASPTIARTTRKKTSPSAAASPAIARTTGKSRPAARRSAQKPSRPARGTAPELQQAIVQRSSSVADAVDLRKQRSLSSLL